MRFVAAVSKAGAMVAAWCDTTSTLGPKRETLQRPAHSLKFGYAISYLCIVFCVVRLYVLCSTYNTQLKVRIVAGFGSLRSLLETLLAIAVAVFVIPIAAVIALIAGGSLSAPASAEVEGSPSLHTSSRITSQSDSSIPASTAYSHVSGVSPSRLHAVLQGSHSQPVVAPELSAASSTSRHQTALLPRSQVIDVSSSSSAFEQEPYPVAEVSGDGRDRISDVLKVLDRRLDNALSGAQGSALRAIPSLAPSDTDEIENARELVKEALELVHLVRG